MRLWPRRHGTAQHNERRRARARAHYSRLGQCIASNSTFAGAVYRYVNHKNGLCVQSTRKKLHMTNQQRQLQRARGLPGFSPVVYTTRCTRLARCSPAQRLLAFLKTDGLSDASCTRRAVQQGIIVQLIILPLVHYLILARLQLPAHRSGATNQGALDTTRHDTTLPQLRLGAARRSEAKCCGRSPDACIEEEEA